jgi:hypothetical protein
VSGIAFAITFNVFINAKYHQVKVVIDDGAL